MCARRGRSPRKFTAVDKSFFKIARMSNKWGSQQLGLSPTKTQLTKWIKIRFHAGVRFHLKVAQIFYLAFNDLFFSWFGLYMNCSDRIEKEVSRKSAMLKATNRHKMRENNWISSEYHQTLRKYCRWLPNRLTLTISLSPSNTSVLRICTSN